LVLSGRFCLNKVQEHRKAAAAVMDATKNQLRIA